MTYTWHRYKEWQKSYKEWHSDDYDTNQQIWQMTHLTEWHTTKKNNMTNQIDVTKQKQWRRKRNDYTKTKNTLDVSTIQPTCISDWKLDET